MMLRANIRLKTRMPVQDLLQVLRKNYELHARIVAEARAGYVEKATKVLTARLEQIKAGKVVGLNFSLSPPRDMSEVYATTIAMLEATTDKEVVLEADEFRQLVQDQWDWTTDFFLTNSEYSGTARRMSSGRASDDDLDSPVGSAPQ